MCLPHAVKSYFNCFLFYLFYEHVNFNSLSLDKAFTVSFVNFFFLYLSPADVSSFKGVSSVIYHLSRWKETESFSVSSSMITCTFVVVTVILKRHATVMKLQNLTHDVLLGILR